MKKLKRKKKYFLNKGHFNNNLRDYMFLLTIKLTNRRVL